MYDIYAQKSNYNFKGKVFNQSRLFKEDTTIDLEPDNNTIYGKWIAREGSDFSFGNYIVGNASSNLEITYLDANDNFIEKTDRFYIMNFTFNGSVIYCYKTIGVLPIMLYRKTTPQQEGFNYIKKINVVSLSGYNQDVLDLFLKDLNTLCTKDNKTISYKKGDVNPYFKVDYDEFMFNITSNNTVEKKQPLANFIVKAEQMSIDTKFKHPMFVQGGYIEYNNKLWIIKTVSEEKGPQKSVYAFVTINPLSTMKMVVEEAQE